MAQDFPIEMANAGGMNTDTMRDETMRSAYHFFLKHAGYSYGPGQTPIEGRRGTAKHLAQAEADAKRFGVTFEWEWDQDADLSWMDEEERQREHEVLYCVARDPSGRPRASLGGVVDADRNYARVIEAELAAEAFATVPHI